MKRSIKILLIKTLLVSLLISLLVSAGLAFEGFRYWRSLSNAEKCVLVSQIKVLKQSPWEAKFYEPQPVLERICLAINKD